LFAGRVRGRDGSRDSINPPYINLPSPNVQEDEQEESSIFPVGRSSSSSSKHNLSTNPTDAENVEDEQAEPPASVLTRRRALVPPKIPPYNMDSSEEADHSSVDKETSTSCHESDGTCGNPRTRRNSIVVIPPMQICPGDLLVYSKVLTQRNNFLDWEGSTQSLAGETDTANARKQKNSWSLLKLFDRSGRAKSESLSGLEEVLACLQPSNFFDDQLSRYRGLCWADFLLLVQKQSATKSTQSSSSTSAAEDNASTSQQLIQPLLPTNPSSSCASSAPSGRVLTRQTTQHDYSNRIKRFGLVRTMSERSLDRKQFTLDKLVLPPLPLPLLYSPSIMTPQNEAREEDQLSPATETLPEYDNGEDNNENESQFPSIAARSFQKSEQRRKEALWDLFQSECAFLYDHLMVLKNVYMDPLKKIQVEGYSMFAEPELLFGNLDELCCVTYSFCKEFVSLLVNHAQLNCADTKTTHILTKLFQKSSKAQILSQAYHRYALNYINALNYLETLRRHLEFCEFEKWCNRDPRCKKLQLTDLLVAPVQHIMKVPLLLREIESRTEDSQ